jgi:nicotinamidase/pyrazinamidase
MQSEVEERIALLIVDVQNDFIDGSLAVPDGASIVQPINELRSRVSFHLVVLTQDWHPHDHTSFIENNPGEQPFQPRSTDGQMMWPAHCVQHSRGAEFHEELIVNVERDVIVRKGTKAPVDSYSGFFDNERHSKTDLDDVLKMHRIYRVFVCGLATDYCVRYTAQDAFQLGYKVSFIQDCSRGISQQHIDVPGVETVSAAELLNSSKATRSQQD